MARTLVLILIVLPFVAPKACSYKGINYWGHGFYHYFPQIYYKPLPTYPSSTYQPTSTYQPVYRPTFQPQHPYQPQPPYQPPYKPKPPFVPEVTPSQPPTEPETDDEFPLTPTEPETADEFPLTPTNPSQGTQVLAQCLQMTNAPQDSVTILGSEEEVTDETQLCFLECYYRAIGIVSGNKFNIKNAYTIARMKYSDPDDLTLVRENLETCQKSVFNDARFTCGVGYTVRKCLTDFANKELRYIMKTKSTSYAQFINLEFLKKKITREKVFENTLS